MWPVHLAGGFTAGEWSLLCTMYGVLRTVVRFVCNPRYVLFVTLPYGLHTVCLLLPSWPSYSFPITNDMTSLSWSHDNIEFQCQHHYPTTDGAPPHPLLCTPR